MEPPSGIVAWWPGDGDAKDINGAYNGTMAGSTSFQAGFVGQAFSFLGIRVTSDVYAEGAEGETLAG